MKEVWPNAEAWYNSDHVIVKINNKFYDIRGEVFPENHIKMSDDPKLFNEAYLWDTQKHDR
jgi:hypothetical protein